MKRALFIVLGLTMGWCCRDGARVHGATRPRPEQIRNIEQVRIACPGCDPRPGTLVSTAQVQNGRTIQVPTGITWPDPADQGKPTVCVQVFIRVALVPPPPPTWEPHNIRQNTCYTQVNLRQLLENPEWLEWWMRRGGQPPPPPESPAMQQMILDILTHPRPVPAQ